MASIVNYVADGATNQFQIPFTYINQADVVVTVNGTTPTFTFVNSTSINIATTPASGAKVIIKRATPLNALVDFTDGSTLFEADLDLAHQQNRLIAEESRDRADSAIATINANITNIDTVAEIASNVNIVAGNTTNVNSVATNMAEVLTADDNAATATTKAGEASASAATASAQATIATTKASESSASEVSALASKNAASVSETNASASETASANSATASANSASASANSATQSGASETVSITKANEASASANAGASSANNSANSATIATTKASEASTSANNSEASKVASQTARQGAENSEINAAASATLATTNGAAQVTLAANQVALATTQVGLAINEADDAANSASTATTKAGEASTSETNAATSEANASASSATATAQASIATTKAGEASTSATNAAASAASAQVSKDAALEALDSFDDRYLGQKSADVTVDNDGNNLVSGALYYNTTDDIMKVYDGSLWVAAYASVSGAMFGANNLSDVASTSGAVANLGLVIGTNVQAFSAILANTTASYTSAEESKLASIETGATADQSASEIRTLVEAATDSNVFTDADHTKLNSIETNAKDDQTITAGSGLSGGGTGNVTLSHSDTSSVANANNSGNTFIQDINFDTYGHVTSVGTGTVSVGNGTLTVSGTGALGGSGTFTANQSGNSTINISHDDTSSQGSVNNSGATVIQDVTLDTYGHITGLASKTLTLSDLGGNASADNIVQYSSDPSGGSQGDIYFNTNNNVLRLHDGTSWVNVSNTPPTATAGTRTLSGNMDGTFSHNVGLDFDDEETADSGLEFQVTQGTLPPGLSLPTSLTGNSNMSGTLTWTGTTATVYNFAIRAVDAAGLSSSAKNYTMTVNPPTFVAYTVDVTSTGANNYTIPMTGMYRIYAVGAGGANGAGSGGVGGTSVSYVVLAAGTVITAEIGERSGLGNSIMRGGNSPTNGRGGGGSYVKVTSGSSITGTSGFGNFLCVAGGGGGAGHHGHGYQFGGSGNGGGGAPYGATPIGVSYAVNGGQGTASPNGGGRGAGTSTPNKLTGGNGGTINGSNYGGAGGGGYGGGGGAASGQGGDDGQEGGYTGDWLSTGIGINMRGGGGGSSHPSACGGSGGGGGGFAIGTNAQITQVAHRVTSPTRLFNYGGSYGNKDTNGEIRITNVGI